MIGSQLFAYGLAILRESEDTDLRDTGAEIEKALDAVLDSDPAPPTPARRQALAIADLAVDEALPLAADFAELIRPRQWPQHQAVLAENLPPDDWLAIDKAFAALEIDRMVIERAGGIVERAGEYGGRFVRTAITLLDLRGSLPNTKRLRD